MRVAAACGSPRPLLVGKNQTIGTAIQHDTISQCSQITQKCRSLTFHIHIRDGTGTVTPTDHVLHGDRRQVAQGHAREPSPERRGTCTVPAGGKYSESPRRCQGRGRGPAEKRSLLHKRTCAKLVHAAASHHRGPCAVAQPLALPMPASCPPCPDCPTTNSLLHKRTCAKLVHAAASHHRGPSVQWPSIADARIMSTMARLPYNQLTAAPASRVKTAPGTHFGVSERIQAQQ